MTTYSASKNRPSGATPRSPRGFVAPDLRRVSAALSIACCAFATACEDDPLGNVAPPPGAQPAILIPTSIEDTFVQRTALASDILFVIDDSGSMGEEQRNLTQNFEAFAQYLFDSEIDYHIGVAKGGVSGDTSDGRLEGSSLYIDQEARSGYAEFTRIVEGIGTEGEGGCESGLHAARAALEEPNLGGFNAGFYRNEATLTVVIVSDENDHAVESDCDWETSRPTSWAEWFLGLKARPEVLHFGVIAGFNPADNESPADCTSPGFGSADAAPAYAYARQLTAGVSWSICSSDWTSVLSDLGVRASGLTRQFNLTRAPRLDLADLDGDGDRTEPRLEVWLDRKDGAGWVKTLPKWDAVPDPRNPWDFDDTQNAVLYTIETMPQPGWELRAVYPNSEEN